MTVILGLAVVLALGGIAAAIFVWMSSLLLAARIGELRARLIASQQDAGAVTGALPEIVRAYAVRAGGRVGAPPIFHARHEARLATGPSAAPVALKAEQWTGIVTPGIVWIALGRIRGLPVSVFDAYVDNRGEFAARLLGAVKVAGGTGPDYDRGELMRYLSELPVYPDAILNCRGLAWRQLDEQTVEVSARSQAGPASVRFVFDDGGDIVRLEADDRPMARGDGTTVPTPWRGSYADYRQFGRYRIPAYGEVGWVLADGLFTYWRGRVVAYGPLGEGRPQA